MKILVWQWGRRGAGPKIAVELAAGLREAGADVVLSLSRQAEIMHGGLAACEMPVDTYQGLAGWVRRLILMPLQIPPLARQIRALRLDGALCAMPAPLDLLVAGALRRAGVPFAVVVHDADLHPGDILPAQAVLQRRLVSRANALVALSAHVAARLEAQRVMKGRPLLRAVLPPLAFGPPPPPPGAHGGKLRLLSFGRLLPYKGLDLLADALTLLGPDLGMEVRIVGSGPETPVLDALRALPGVTVENRWVTEADVGALLAWADAMVLSHREASQSGVAAAALAARRWVVSTRAGGLAEQFAGEPLARLCDAAAPSLAAALAGLLTDPPDGAGGSMQPFAATAARLAGELDTVFSHARAR